MIKNSFFASCPKNVEDILVDELKLFSAQNIKTVISGAYFEGSIESAYRACLWSRVANHIYLIMKEFEVNNKEDIFNAALTIEWDEHFFVDKKFAVTCTLSSDRIINHNHYGALIVKDAIADYFNRKYNKRPSVDKDNPDILFHIHVGSNTATINLDLSGDSLHKRGYRISIGKATLKENIGASLLIRANWPEVAKDMGTFIDPMCGSGTLPIEAALIAGDIAPGLFKEKYGFDNWNKHHKDLWRELVDEAKDRKKKGLKKIPKILGYDSDALSVANAKKNIDAIVLSDIITIEKKKFEYVTVPGEIRSGLLAVDPPYGHRMGTELYLPAFYKKIGKVLVENFPGWYATIITGDEELSKNIGLKAHKVNTLYNGAIRCTLAHFKLFSNEERAKVKEDARSKPLSKNARMFANRLSKNLKNLKKWLAEEKISCYRVYDADMPEYSAAIDYYENKWIVIQEYAPPATIKKEDATRRLNEIKKGVLHVLEVEPKNIFIKQRQKQLGKNQYTKFESLDVFQEIKEDGLIFLVNFSDYLDTGIFLDHRVTRKMIREKSNGKRFLNLFAYTGSATVYAAAGGAASTMTVDKSSNYINWAKDNMSKNNFTSPSHKFIKSDCIDFLIKDTGFYDLIFIDPPTFSNSKDNRNTFDIQRDHVKLIKLAIQKVEKDGEIIFSNNFRKFKMDINGLNKLKITNITETTIPKDFERNKKIHNCWHISY